MHGEWDWDDTSEEKSDATSKNTRICMEPFPCLLEGKLDVLVLGE